MTATPLTNRSIHMIFMRGSGRTNQQIGEFYGISEDYARTTIRRTVTALGATDVVHALAILLVITPDSLDILRQDITIPEQARHALQSLTDPAEEMT
jgi:DNA-binding CsgD family transcriptional regulator